MNKKILKLENCLKTMKKCLKIPNVENCICFSDAFKVLNLEADELDKEIDQISDFKDRQKLVSIKKEIKKIKGNISEVNKECLGCSSCIASVVFKTYPNRLDSLYLDNEV